MNEPVILKPDVATVTVQLNIWEMAQARIAALEAQLAEANGVIDANRWPDTAAKLLREAESRAEAAGARESRLRAALTRIRDERGVRPYHVAREALRPAPEQPGDSDAGLVWPRNEIRRVKAKRGETRVRPPFVISDDAEQPAESENRD